LSFCVCYAVIAGLTRNLLQFLKETEEIAGQELEVEKDKTIVLKKETMAPNPLLSGK